MKTAKFFIASVIMVSATSSFASLPCNAKAVKGGILGSTAAKVATAKSTTDKTVVASSSNSNVVK